MQKDSKSAQSTPSGTPERYIAQSLQYRCPGEGQPISRAVHLNRLAEGFAACKNCEHRDDAGPVAVSLRSAGQDESSIWRAEGIRGTHYESITPQRIATIATAFAEVLCRNAIPPTIPSPEVTQRRPHLENSRSKRPPGPKLIVGCDARLSSRTLFVGLIESLSRWGCSVIDVGMVSRPCLDFAVASLQTTGGLYITGGTEPQRFNGLDLVGAHAEPWSYPGRLQDVVERESALRPRPTRRMVPTTSFDPSLAYRAALQPHFHALRPLRVGLLCDCPLTARTLDGLFAQLPCSLESVPPPANAGTRTPQSRLTRLSGLVQSRHLDLGVVIEADGRSCHLIDECGEPVDGDSVLLALAELETLEHNSVGVVSPPRSGHHRLPPGVERFVSPEALPRHENLVEQLMRGRARIAFDGQGRYWFRDSVPACDAVITLGRLLQRLSLEDRRVSEAIAAIGERDVRPSSR